MRHFITTVILFMFGISVLAQDVKIQGPKRQQTTVSKPKPKPSSGTQSSKPVEVYYDSNQKAIVYGNSTYKMLFVGAGIFNIGDYDSQVAFEGKMVSHRVALSSYCLGQTEVTQGLWKAIMGNNPSKFKGDNLPVENVSWEDCQTFLKRLNSLTGKDFCLPTEAEWEFAARGGNLHSKKRYPGSNDENAVAWGGNNSGDKTHQVATKQCNELYLYDMCGNVYEWCQDWDGTQIQSRNPVTNPFGAEYGNKRVYRGGSYKYGGYIEARASASPEYRSENVGFRICIRSNEGYELGQQSYINTNHCNYRKYSNKSKGLLYKADIAVAKINAVNIMSEGNFSGWKKGNYGFILIDGDYQSLELKNENPLLLHILPNTTQKSTNNDGSRVTTYMAESTDGSNAKVKVSNITSTDGELFLLIEYSEKEALFFGYTIE